MTTSEINDLYSQWLSENSQPSNHDCHRRAAFNFLKVCVDQNDKDINFFFLTEANKSREELVNEIIFDTNGKLGVIFTDQNGLIDKKGTQYIHFIIDWLIKRYDLSTSAKLIGKAIWQKEPVAEGFWKTLWEHLLLKYGNIAFPFIFIVLLIYVIFAEYSGIKLLSEVWAGIKGAYTNLDIRFPFSVYVTILAFIYPFIVISLLASLFRNISLVVKLFVPRMVGGIIVGYLPLLISDEAWRTIENLRVLDGTLLFVAAIIFSGYYLFIEVRNTVKEKLVSLIRAMRVLALGLLESFIIGLIIADLITDALIRESDVLADLVSKLEPGLFGHIYPKMVLLYFPLALLIGIFLQIFWEDKPITHPI